MRWKVYLDGQAQDLELLREMFPSGSSPIGVDLDEHGTFMVADALAELEEPGAVHSAAKAVLIDTNGATRVLHPHHRAVTLRGRYEDDQGHVAAVVDLGIAQERDTALAVARMPPPSVTGDVIKVEPAQALGPRLAELSNSNHDVSDALTILGTSKTLGWAELYKLYEVVRGAAGDVVSRGWISDRERKAFTASANRPDVSGTSARHARTTGAAPRHTMSEAKAQALILDLVRQWLNSLANRP